MLRFLNIVAILTLIGSAVYAYSIKYQTSYRAEQIAKTKIEIKQERDAIAVLRAEWAFMTRPERLQQLVDAHLPDMKPVEVTQLVAATQLPDKAARVDQIGLKLDALLGAPEGSADALAGQKAPPKAAATPKPAAPKLATAAKPTAPVQSHGQSVGQKKP